MSRIVLTDPHGCLDTLKALVAKLPAGIPLTFAGDLIDRGPNSKGVIEFVKSGGHDCVVGNHEVMMLDELRFDKDKDGEYYNVKSYLSGIWLMNGGDKMLDSYKDDTGEVILKDLKVHYEWVKSLPYYMEYPELKNDKGQHLLVTHTTAASVWGKHPTDSDHFKTSVTWERAGIPKKIKNVFNVYGHTPQQKHATVRDHFANIDTGCYFGKQPYGKLTAIQFPEIIIFEQEYIEKEQ